MARNDTRESLIMKNINEIVEKLCDASRNDYNNPYDLKWPETLPSDTWFFSPELISIYGTEQYERMNEDKRKQLSFYEAINFFSLNIHGEKPLAEGLARRLYSKKHLNVSNYLHHFLDEENKHMIYFAGFCMRYASKIYPDKKMTLSREYAEGEEDFLFFVKVMIFEELVDVYNVKMARDERLSAIVREINRLHHRDEARHLVFGREIVSEIFRENKKRWSEETLENIRQYLNGYFVSTWREYFNSEVYKDAGLKDPFDIPETAFETPASRTRRKEISSKCIQFLLQHEILVKEPEL